MKKFSQIKQRIRQLFENQGIDIKEIYKNCGISDGTFSNESGLSEDNLLKFFSYYSWVDAEWLLTGKGKPIKSDADVMQLNEPEVPYSSDYKEKYYKVTEQLKDTLLELNELRKEKDKSSKQSNQPISKP